MSTFHSCACCMSGISGVVSFAFCHFDYRTSSESFLSDRLAVGRKKRALRVKSDITFPIFELVCFYFEGGMTVPPVNGSFPGLLPAFLSVYNALSAMVNGRKNSSAKTRFG
ncbi:hypothetical protein NXY01_02985 [Bacteroides fragilis]|nr:hypothetical protein NXY01_02985 [Bacteroides fragilis]UVV76051.1 hypothetical protein NXW84_18395 [Bacteroides fragilis]